MKPLLPPGNSPIEIALESIPKIRLRAKKWRNKKRKKTKDSLSKRS